MNLPSSEYITFMKKQDQIFNSRLVFIVYTYVRRMSYRCMWYPQSLPKTNNQTAGIPKDKANHKIEGGENSLGRMISHRRRSLIPARSLHTTRLIVNFLFMLHERTAGAERGRCALAAPGALDAEAFADFAAFEHQWDPLGAQVGR